MLNEELPQQQNNTHFETNVSEEALKERQYLWMARTFALVLVVSFLTTLMLISALMSLTPIVRVQPFFLTTLNKDQQVIEVQRPNFRNINVTLLTESFIRQYLLSYFSVSSNISELERRWGIDGDINWMSETSVFTNFGRDAEKWLKLAKTKGLTRNVKILVVRQLRETRTENIWTAEIELTEMTNDSPEPIKSKWRATMYIAYRPTRPGLIWEQRLRNPLGFTVLRIGFEPIK